jgi:acetoin utilization deacetylase AcuC-like enzyme
LHVCSMACAIDAFTYTSFAYTCVQHAMSRTAMSALTAPPQHHAGKRSASAG